MPGARQFPLVTCFFLSYFKELRIINIRLWGHKKNLQQKSFKPLSDLKLSWYFAIAKSTLIKNL